MPHFGQYFHFWFIKTSFWFAAPTIDNQRNSFDVYAIEFIKE